MASKKVWTILLADNVVWSQTALLKYLIMRLQCIGNRPHHEVTLHIADRPIMRSQKALLIDLILVFHV